MNEQQIAVLVQEFERVRALRVRYEALLKALDEHGKSTGFVSLAEEVFVPGSASDETFLTHVGADIMVELSRDEAKAFFARRVEKLREAEVILLKTLEQQGGV